MRLRKLFLGGVAAAGLLVVPITAASAQATGPINGHARFFTTADAGSGPGPLVLSGRVLNGVCVDNQGDTVDNVVCRGGTFQIDHSGEPATQNFNFNTKTCVGTFTATGAPFSFLNGTGKYAGLSGGGLADVKGAQIAPRLPGGACNPDPNATPVFGFTSIHASFHADLPGHPGHSRV
jgi:hypothetical protein